jgi:hypothetical protein
MKKCPGCMKLNAEIAQLKADWQGLRGLSEKSLLEVIARLRATVGSAEAEVAWLRALEASQ